MKPPVAILGGSGNLGSGLARRLRDAGYEVLIASRDPERGIATPDAVEAAEIVFVTIPFAHHASVLGALGNRLEGKILVDTTVPLIPPKVSRVQMPPQGCAALAAQEILGTGVRIVSAFQNVAADLLKKEGPVDCDILVAGDDPAARSQVIAIVQDIGLRGLHAGPLANSAAAEALTSVLIFLNRHYGGHAGIQITGLEQIG